MAEINQYVIITVVEPILSSLVWKSFLLQKSMIDEGLDRRRGYRGQFALYLSIFVSDVGRRTESVMIRNNQKIHISRQSAKM